MSNPAEFDWYVCDKCLDEGRQQLVEPDEEFCPSYGCKIDWDKVGKMDHIQSKTGKEYFLSKQPHKNFYLLIRVDSGKSEKITLSKIQNTKERLESGEEIPSRSISYTVAIETAIVHILKNEGVIKINQETKTYSLN